MSVDARGGIDYRKIKTKFDESLEDYGPNWAIGADERIKRRLFWRDTMENWATCKWNAYYPTTTTLTYINTVQAFQDDYILSVTEAAETHYEIDVTFGCFTKQKIGFEMKWFCRSGINLINVNQTRCEENTEKGVRGIVQWDSTLCPPRWKYENSAGTKVDIPDATERIAADTWNYLRLIIDWTEGTYYRLQTNLLDLDLSSLTLRTRTVDTAGEFQIVLGWTNQTANYANYVDDTRIYLKDE